MRCCTLFTSNLCVNLAVDPTLLHHHGDMKDENISLTPRAVGKKIQPHHIIQLLDL